MTIYNVGGTTRINTATALPSATSVITLPDGGWVVTWGSYDDGGAGVVQQRFDSSGNVAGPLEQIANIHTASSQETPQITGLSGGGWIITWSSSGQDGSGWGVYQQKFNSQGNAMWIDDHIVNTTVAGSQNEFERHGVVRWWLDRNLVVA